MLTPKYQEGMGILYKTKSRYGDELQFGIILKPLILKLDPTFKEEVFYEIYAKGLIMTIPETFILSSFENPY